MSLPTELKKTPTVGGAQRLPAAPARAVKTALARRIAGRLRNDWLPWLTWSIGRTGRTGMLGLALLTGAGVFLVSTHLEVAAEVEAMRSSLEAQSSRPRVTSATRVQGPAAVLGALPPRTELPAILRQIFNKASQARLSVDTGKYEVHGTGSGGVVHFQVAFPVTGSYQEIRTFVDSALAALPSVALTEMTLDRKATTDPVIEAQLRMTIFMAAPPVAEPKADGASGALAGLQPGSHFESAGALAQALPNLSANSSKAAGPGSGRVVVPTQAASFFAAHSWYVIPPAPLPPPPAEPPPPPPPTAPPFPYTLIGSYAPEGQPAVFFLSKGDQIIDAHVGDQFDGVYRFESANGGQLVFVYLPLDVRQTIPVGAAQ